MRASNSPTVDAEGRGSRRCRFCGAILIDVVVDLGVSPLCEQFVAAGDLDKMEPFFPLVPRVCRECKLVQLPEFVSPETIFSEYAYFSSYSDSWVDHARRYAELMTRELALGGSSFVVEVGSNDGYLLQHFVRAGIPVLGVEPAANVAATAIERGVPTRVAFFGRDVAEQLADERGRADLIAVKNVLAQVPDLNDFVAGLAALLKPTGTLTIEFPHVLELLRGNQFDTIYHEHFSYFSLLTSERLMAAHGLRIDDVETVPTHGGSLRLFIHPADFDREPSERVVRLRAAEAAGGIGRVETYTSFGLQVEALKRSLLAFLIDLKERGRSIAGYGAPGKANTLLNYCGIRTDFVDFTVDRNPYKHGRYTPGTRIPILPPDELMRRRPDYVWILPWNLRTEIAAQLRDVRAWGGTLFVAIPSVAVVE